MAVVVSLVYVLLGVLAFLLVITLVAWALYIPIVVRGFSQTPYLFAEINPPREEGQECSFSTSDRLTLRGTYLPTAAERRLGVIAFCHELTSDRWSALPYVSDLRERGYDVFAFDFRNHGTSDRLAGYEPMPWVTRYEVDDVLAAVNYLAGRDDADSRGVGLIGISRGGTAALCAAAEDPRVRAVVTDGAFPVEEMQIHYMRRYMEIYLRYSWLLSKLPSVCLISFCRWGRLIVGWQRRCRFVNVTQAVRRIRQPVFMIHGERDTYVPLPVVLQLRFAISRRTRLWVVDGARHNRAIDVAPRRYQARIARFFRNHLASSCSAPQSQYVGCPAPPQGT
jgi:pimeloyl-ACP methyl ester carboxylesterase